MSEIFKEEVFVERRQVPRDRAISVIIPVYNEELNVEEVHARLAEVLQGGDVEFIFIDDGSTDGTVTRLDRKTGKFTRIAPSRVRCYNEGASE